MAKNKSRRRASLNARQRRYYTKSDRYPSIDLRSIEDRRTPVQNYGSNYSNIYSQPAYYGFKTRLVMPRDPRPRAAWHPLKTQFYAQPLRVESRPAFLQPELTVTCLRRDIRRQVLFARNKLGSGGAKLKHPHFTLTSKISCRR